MPGPLLITEILFKCNKCGTTWFTHLDKALTCADEIKDWLRTKMQPCPANCGGKTADVAFKLDSKSDA